MLDCGYECHRIGGPWIAENPTCPYHNIAAQNKEARNEKIQEILLEVWYRNMSADDGWDMIEDLLD